MSSCYRCERALFYRGLARFLIYATILAAGLFLIKEAKAADDWSTDNTVAEVSYQLVNAIDYAQTIRIKDRPDLVEGNWAGRAWMGREPHGTGAVTYFATLAVSHYVISRLLPAKWRPYWQVGTLAASGYNVIRNCTEYGLLCPRENE